MSARELTRVEVLSRVKAGTLSLGSAATQVWHGRGRAARLRLRNLAPASGEGSSDPWFGSGRSGRRALDLAARRLEVEALLLQLQEELSRTEVPADDLVDTAARLLCLADELPCPWRRSWAG